MFALVTLFLVIRAKRRTNRGPQGAVFKHSKNVNHQTNISANQVNGQPGFNQDSQAYPPLGIGKIVKFHSVQREMSNQEQLRTTINH